jgi:hypothetical protein
METKRWAALLGSVCALSVGCAQDDPEATTPSTDGGVEDPCNPDEVLAIGDDPTCSHSADDYGPGKDDAWPACISDDGSYHPIEPSISSIARIGAFEQIAVLLAFDGSRVPTAKDFLDARVVYTQQEGLESRVVRREDEHYPPATASCRDLTEAEQMAQADRCVGPALIRPLINDAFQQGAVGQDLVRNAARIEAALLWFFYVSTHKEAMTCASAPKDCDSSYAYYTGGEQRGGGLGLSRYVRVRSPQAHDRIWDGILAVRCWRDLDNPTGSAQDTAMQGRAVSQLDRALLRGIAVIVRQRLDNLACQGAWETVKILGPVLLREAEVRNPATAASLRTQLEQDDPALLDVDATKASLDALFPCP